MARTPTHPPLNVLLNGRMVGRLRRAPSGAIDFTYDPTWLNWENGFAVSLSLPLREDRYVGDAVVAVFDNLLPDDESMRAEIAARRGAAGSDPYSLLSAIGRDCVGALQFVPDGEDPGVAGAIDAVPVSDEALGETLQNLATVPLGMGEDLEFRISIAGAQEKAALLLHDGAWHVPHGSTATTHILKPQIGMRGQYDFTRSVENEHLCMRILAELGLPVANTEIVDFAGTRALVIERFDRHWTQDGRLLRRPQEDCCQALSCPPVRKYQRDGGPSAADILDFLKASDRPAEDQRLFMRAQIAFWLLAATDGHAKNFSVFLYPKGGFDLTPLYDVVSTQHLYDAGTLRRRDMKLAMSVGNSNHYRLHDILPRHFVQTARQVGMPPAQVQLVIDELKDRVPQALDTARNQLGPNCPEDLGNNICDGAAQRLQRL